MTAGDLTGWMLAGGGESYLFAAKQFDICALAEHHFCTALSGQLLSSVTFRD